MRTIANDALGLNLPPAQQRLKFLFDLCLHVFLLLSIEICQNYVSEILYSGKVRFSGSPSSPNCNPDLAASWNGMPLKRFY
jgi:hypothetical protein